jgi:hypothetical protein
MTPPQRGYRPPGEVGEGEMSWAEFRSGVERGHWPLDHEDLRRAPAADVLCWADELWAAGGPRKPWQFVVVNHADGLKRRAAGQGSEGGASEAA